MEPEILARDVELVPLDTLEPTPGNPNRGDVAAIAQSIDAVGFYAVVYVQRSSRRIIAGEHRWRAAAEHGLTHVPVVWLDVDDETAARIMAADNEIPRRHSQPDDQALVALLGTLAATPRGLLGTGYDDAALRDLIKRTTSNGHGSDPGPSAPPAEPVTKPGDLWALGPHRLLCGDSFDADDTTRLLEDHLADLVLTDPPFAIYGSATGIAADIADDKMVRPFFEALGRLIGRTLKEFGHAYVHCDWRSYATLWDGFKRGGGLVPKNCLVWDKGGSGLGSNFANTHEFVAFFARLPQQYAMTSHDRAGQRSVFASNVLRYNRVTGDERQHNAAKPVELLAELIGHSTDPGELVVDYFAGSGSTLMAAEQTGRRAALMEIDPPYCDTIVQRWERATGQTAAVVDRRVEASP